MLDNPSDPREDLTRVRSSVSFFCQSNIYCTTVERKMTSWGHRGSEPERASEWPTLQYKACQKEMPVRILSFVRFERKVEKEKQAFKVDNGVRRYS